LERNGTNLGDAGDLYREGDQLLPSIDVMTGPFPNTDSYQGGRLLRTGICITDISLSGPTMRFCVSFMCAPCTIMQPSVS
jgi:hypothetical protein